MASRYGFRPVAIALVVDEGNGELTLYGSKQLDNFTIEINRDIGSYCNGDFVKHYALPAPPYVRIEAECRGLVVHRTTPVPTPPQIEQRGIYLPDMSFRALPAPGGDDA